MTRIRLGIVATHPVQYHVPWFRGLAARPDLDLKVYFALLPDAAQQGIGFGIPFKWDIPMLEGYSWEALPNVRSHPKLGRFFGSSTPGIYDALRRDKPDAVVITGWNAWPLLQTLRACARLGIPGIVRGESNALRPRAAWKGLVHRALLARFDGFLAIGKANRAFYLANGVDESKVFLAPYFVDNEHFSRAAQAFAHDRSNLRRAWGVPEDATCFLFAGKLEPKKRILDLVSAMASLRAGSDRAHLLVVGTGALMDQAKALAARTGARVSFAGFLNQTEVPKAYAVADCLVLPSDYGETWGLVVNEAMSCGVPAVVSDRVGCAPDLVEEGVTGKVFPFADVDALTRALQHIGANPEEARSMGRRARDKVRDYSVERSVDATVAAVQAVLETKRREK